MNSRERIKNILEGVEFDRAGLGFFAIDSDIAAKVLGRETYWRNKVASQVAFWQGRRDEVVQSWIEDGIELYKKLRATASKFFMIQGIANGGPIILV